MANHFSGDIETIKGLTIRRTDTGETVSLKGREAWCMAQLIVHGNAGVTPLERPAPRWSDYVFRLRKRLLPVRTIDEAHGGAYRGHHARYRLETSVDIIEQEFAA